MIFFSDKAEKNGPKVEAKLRKELGVPTELLYTTTFEGNYKPGSFSEAIGDAATVLFGGECRPLYTFHFKITYPRKFEFSARVVKSGATVVLGALLFSTIIEKKITTPLVFERGAYFSSSKFTGDDSVVVGKLNTAPSFLKRSNKFVKDSYRVGNSKIKIESFFKITPFDGKGLLTLQTLPKKRWFGFSSRFDTATFLQIVSAIEDAL